MKVSVVCLERIILGPQCLRLKALASPLQVILDSFGRAIPNIKHFQNMNSILKCRIKREQLLSVEAHSKPEAGPERVMAKPAISRDP